jgi:hypothetical protein
VIKIPVGRLGQWRHPKYGTIKMSQQLFDDMIKNFKQGVIGRDPFIRIGHDKGDSGTFGDAKAEGWIKDLVQEGPYLFALAEPTNKDVADMVQNKQYRYSSAEYNENYIDKETGDSKGAVLEALALTNEPFLTRLPEARLLSDPKETFYLDYEEVSSMLDKELLDEVKQTNTLLGTFTTKLAEFFGGKKEDKTDSTQTIPVNTDDPKKLSEYETRMKALEEENKRIKLAQHNAEVDVKLAGYVALGIPPVVIDQVKLILLADITGEKVIKLSDDKAISQSEQIYEMLDKFPQESRIQLSQAGTQTPPPASDSPEATKKLADEDMKALGYKLTEDGKYTL